MNERWWTTKQVAEHYQLHPKTIATAARKGELQGRKFGRGWKFRLSWVEEWVGGRWVTTGGAT